MSVTDAELRHGLVAEKPRLLEFRDEKVLLIGPNPDEVKIISDILSYAGLQNIVSVPSLDETIDYIRTNIPGIIFIGLDELGAPQIDICQSLRNYFGENVPIFVYLPDDSFENRSAAFRAGVTEIISDTSSRAEIVIRTSRAMQRSEMIERFNTDKLRLSRDLHAAQRMQSALLQNASAVHAIAEPRHVDIDYVYQASNLLGGDWWRVLPIDKERVGLLMFDLSGHGISSAINAFRLQLIIDSLKEDRHSPAIWMTRLNRELHGMLSIEQFASGFYGVYNRWQRKLTYVNAGSPTPFILKADGKTTVQLSSTGPILGCSSDLIYGQESCEMFQRDRLVLYSDALYENFKDPTKTLSTHELADVVIDASQKSTETGEPFCRQLLKSLGYVPEQRFDDDLTLMSMQVTAIAPRGRTTSRKPIVDGVWIALADAPFTNDVVDVLAQHFDENFFFGDDLPEGSTVCLVLADDSHAHMLEYAKSCASDFQKVVFIGDQTESAARADFVLETDTTSETIQSVCKACIDLLQQSNNLRQEVSVRKSAIGTLKSGTFSFSTLEQARNLSTMLALACPNADLVALGLQELMVNAVEHGNLEITAKEKDKLMITGKWREEVEHRLVNKKYAGREAVVEFRRDPTEIVFRIRDEGQGFDYQSLDVPTDDPNAYRGRGIALARDLSFSSIEFIGKGNEVKATILCDDAL